MADREYRIDVTDADGTITERLYFDGSDDYDEALDEAAIILDNHGHVAGDVWVATEGTTCDFVDSVAVVPNFQKGSTARIVEFAFGAGIASLFGSGAR